VPEDVHPQATVEALDLVAVAITEAQMVGFARDVTIRLPGSPYTSAALTWEGYHTVLSLWSSTSATCADLAM
jgi:hypothetical protein